MRSTVLLIGWPTAFCCLCAATVAFCAQVEPRAPVSEGIALGPNDRSSGADSDASIDEQLFLARAVEHTYLRWPDDWTDPESACDRIARIESDLIRCHVHAKNMPGVDVNLVELIGDARRLARDYADMLIDLGIIKQEQYNDRVNYWGKAAGSVLGATAVAGASGVMRTGTPWGALWALPALLSETWRGYSGLNKLGIEQQRQLSHLIEAYRRKQAETLDNAERLARLLERRHNWAPGEAGFKQIGTPSDQSALPRAETMEQRAVLKAAYRDLKKTRPRDAFLYSELGMLLLADANEADGPQQKGDALRQAAAEFERAAALVPKDAFHDRHRVDLLLQAAQADADFSYWSRSQSKRGLELAQKAHKKYDQADVGGEIRHVHAHALARAGRAKEAVEMLGEIEVKYTGKPLFACDQARFLSLAGEHDSAAEKLERALQCGYDDIAFLTQCADLAAFRSAKAERFKALIQVKADVTIDFEYTNWLYFKNNSGFPLTNVFLNLTWTPNEGPERTFILYTDVRLNPGQSYCWRNVPALAVSTEGNLTRAIRRCDQEKGFDPPPLRKLIGDRSAYALIHSARNPTACFVPETKASLETLAIGESQVRLGPDSGPSLPGAPREFTILRYSHGLIECEKDGWVLRLWVYSEGISGVLLKSDDPAKLKALWTQ